MSEADVRMTSKNGRSISETVLQSQVPIQTTGDDTGRAAFMAEPDRFEHEPESELLWIVRALRVRWKLIALLTTILVTAASVAANSVVPLYSATATILIDPGQNEYTDLGSSPGARQDVVWPAELESYMKVLWSDRLAALVVASVGPEAFQVRPSALHGLLHGAAGLIEIGRTWLDRYFGGAGGSEPSPPQPADTDAPAPTSMSRAIDVFRQNLLVERDSLAAVLNVTYRDPDPEVAERVANATAEAFPKELVSTQEDALTATTDYLRERVAALQRELQAAESEMQTLQDDLARSDGSSMARVRYGEIIRALSETEAENTGLRLDVAEAGGGAGQPLSDRLASPLLQQLRLQRVQHLREIAQLRAEVGDRHPQMAALLATSASTQAEIREEEGRICGQLQRALSAGEAKIGWLRQEMARVEAALGRGMNDEVRLRQLDTRTESTRQVYQDILSRYQRASEQQRMVRPPARVINVAQRPEAPERRQIYLALAAAAIASLAASAALALLLELRRSGFRLADELAAATGQPLVGTLPLVTRGLSRGVLLDNARDSRRQEYVEAVRRLALHVVPPGKSQRGTVVAVTSAIPGEGKSIASLSLARQLAEIGFRVLLVDADLHKGTIQRLVDLPTDPTGGLAALLRSDVPQLDAALIRDTRTDLDILPAGCADGDPARLLAGAGMHELLEAARTRYDAIIVDTPPVLSVTDATFGRPFG